VQPAAGAWEDWLRKLPEAARSEPAEPASPGARRAVLRYRRLQACAGGTLVEFQPETGRMHQIRLQTSLRGWPIRGDVLYGATLPFGPPVELPRERIIALHARRLTFLHPIRYEPITVVAPLPAAWGELGLEMD
jgi:23S rRNA pseudouridine1911/1915/1917 synthase